MIIEFRVQNFRSFREEQTLSLVASNYDKSLPDNLIKFPKLEDTLLKAAAIYGPNAGGKTNLLLALQFLRWLVVESAAGQKPDSALPKHSFALDNHSLNEPTILELILIAENVRYEFAVALDSKRIVQERLVAYPNERAQIWYDRVWNEDEHRYEWSPEKPIDFDRDPGIMEKTRGNALFLSTAAQWNNTQILPIYKWFSEKLVFLNLGSRTAQLTEDFTADMMAEGDNRKVFTHLLRTADFGVTSVEATKQSPTTQAVMREMWPRPEGDNSPFSPKNRWEITLQHEGKDGQSFPINWSDESAGTHRFFSLIGPWLSIFPKEHILCVDEFETSLHPVLAAELLRLLFSIRHKERSLRAQLLFTTHNPLLLDMTLLRRDQIWFADKNLQGESFLYPLTDYKPRADESLVRGYLSGRYGAVPFIPHGLMDGSHNDSALAEAPNAS